MARKKIPLSPEARELKNAYQREWRAKNKDKLRKYNANMWEKKAAQLSAKEQENEMVEQTV